MAMSYTREDLIKFLIACDLEMKSQMRILIIGGASLTLAYNFSNTTVDVDLLTQVSNELKEAIEIAKAKTNIDIKVSTTGVYADIMNMENRLVFPRDLAGLKRLQICVPEKHDLALMKCARSEARDIEDIRGLNRIEGLDPQILFSRFKNELLPLNSGDDKLLKDRFLDMIDTLFDSELASEFESKL